MTLPLNFAFTFILRLYSEENRVLLYMKGSPAAPQCGFSNMACQILNFHGVEFASRNVLVRPAAASIPGGCESRYQEGENSHLSRIDKRRQLSFNWLRKSELGDADRRVLSMSSYCCFLNGVVWGV